MLFLIILFILTLFTESQNGSSEYDYSSEPQETKSVDKENQLEVVQPGIASLMKSFGADVMKNIQVNYF